MHVLKKESSIFRLGWTSTTFVIDHCSKSCKIVLNIDYFKYFLEKYNEKHDSFHNFYPYGVFAFRDLNENHEHIIEKIIDLTRKCTLTLSFYEIMYPLFFSTMDTSNNKYLSKLVALLFEKQIYPNSLESVNYLLEHQLMPNDYVDITNSIIALSIDDCEPIYREYINNKINVIDMIIE